jgi:hypothetical protein
MIAVSGVRCERAPGTPHIDVRKWRVFAAGFD